jgi:hypothetical protein
MCVIKCRYNELPCRQKCIFLVKKILGESVYQIFNQLSGYDVLICHALLFIIVAMTSVHVVFVRSSSYFRVWQEGADFLIAVLGSSYCE